MNILNKILFTIFLTIFTCTVLLAATTQDEGRTYFTVNAFSANTDNATTNGYATGQVSVSLTDGLYVKSVDYQDDGAYFEYALSIPWIESAVNPYKVKVSDDDTTPDYLGVKLTGGDGLTGTEINPGANERFELDVNVKAGVLEIDGDDVDIADDGVGDEHVDWGVAAGQVSAVDMPVDDGTGDTRVLFNDGGVFGTDADFTWNKTTNELTISGGGESITIDGINDTITASGGTLGFGDDHTTTTATMTAGGTTYPAGEPIADVGSPGYLLEAWSDGSSAWIDPDIVMSTYTLDLAYDAGNTIDYTGASGAGDAVILSVVNGEDPGYFLMMYYDGVLSYTFMTESNSNAFRIFDDSGSVAHLFGGMTGSVILNSNQESGGDFKWFSSDHQNAIKADASANTISIVGTELYIGDVNDQTDLLLADGSGNYITLAAPPIGADWKLTLPVDDGDDGEVLATDGSGNARWATAGPMYLQFNLPVTTPSASTHMFYGIVSTTNANSPALMRPGSITGISFVQTADLQPPLGEDIWNIQVYVNGASVWSTEIKDASNENEFYATQVSGTDAVSAGDNITVFCDYVSGTTDLTECMAIVEITFHD